MDDYDWGSLLSSEGISNVLDDPQAAVTDIYDAVLESELSDDSGDQITASSSATGPVTYAEPAGNTEAATYHETNSYSNGNSIAPMKLFGMFAGTALALFALYKFVK